MISAGRLIHTLTIETQTGKTQSASGAIVPVWTASEPLYAEIKPLHGRSVEEALIRTKGKSVSHQITMRYPGFDVKPVKNRIKFRGRTFEIFSVVDVLERNIELDILAQEIIA